MVFFQVDKAHKFVLETMKIVNVLQFLALIQESNSIFFPSA